MYKRTKSNPHPNTCCWKKNKKKHPLEIKFSLQVAQFVFDRLGETPVCLRGGEGWGWGWGGSQWQRKGERKEKKETSGEKASLFLCASQYLYTQSDPAVPRPREDPDEPGVDGRLYHVLSVRVVVEVPLEHLQQGSIVVSTAALAGEVLGHFQRGAEVPLSKVPDALIAQSACRGPLICM